MGRIFSNNETFPSALDPCLSCICLVRAGPGIPRGFAAPAPWAEARFLAPLQGKAPGALRGS